MPVPSQNHLVIDSNPDPENARFLDDQLYEFNIQTTGVMDGDLLAVFLRGPNDEVIGGSYGWTWGGTCYIRYLFVPTGMRNQGCGTRIICVVEQEALRRQCVQIVLETHDFQAPGFYAKLGFAIVGSVDGFPRGHKYLTMLKRLPQQSQTFHPASQDP